MRNPTAKELSQLYETIRDIKEVEAKHREELLPLMRIAEEEAARIARECGAPPGLVLDEIDRCWRHPRTREMVEPDE